jgi:3-dehydroquinate dehydratase-2
MEQRRVPIVYLLNGPNLNMLGRREPEIYGRTTLAEIEAMCVETAGRLGLELVFRQTNCEGELVGWVQEACDQADALIINPAAFTHTSVALMDALAIFPGPVIELHLSNIHRREPWRHHSYVSLKATGIICGFGADGYVLALEAAARLLARGARGSGHGA